MGRPIDKLDNKMSSHFTGFRAFRVSCQQQLCTVAVFEFGNKSMGGEQIKMAIPSKLANSEGVVCQGGSGSGIGMVLVRFDGHG